MTRPIHPDVEHFGSCPHNGRIRPCGDRFCPDHGGRPIGLEICLRCPLHNATGPAPPKRPKCGDVLATLLFERYGAVVTAQCNCADRINQMNEWAPDGCETNLETIVDWLIESAATVAGAHNLLPEWAQRIGLRALIREAIKTVRDWTPPELGADAPPRPATPLKA